MAQLVANPDELLRRCFELFENVRLDLPNGQSVEAAKFDTQWYEEGTVIRFLDRDGVHHESYLIDQLGPTNYRARPNVFVKTIHDPVPDRSPHMAVVDAEFQRGRPGDPRFPSQA